jgi:O-antigen ligase
MSNTENRGIGRSGWALGAYFALAPAGATGGGLVLAPLMGLAALAGAPLRLTGEQRQSLLAPALAVTVFGVYVALSMLWSPVARFEQSGKVLAVLVGGLLFVAAAVSASARGKAMITAVGAGACLVLIALLAVEAWAGMPFNRMAQPNAEAGALARNPGKGVSILVVLVWGLMASYGAAGGWRGGLAALALAGAAALSPQFDMNANLVGLAAGVAAYGLGLAAPTFVLGLVAGGLALWMLAAPFLTPVFLSMPGLAAQLPLSWQMRLEIWRFAEARISEKPISGWGLDGGRSFAGELSRIGEFTFQSLPLHPHSASLHVWLETGAIGAGLAAVAILTVAASVARALAGDRFRLAAAAGAMAAIGVIWNVSYGAWQEWWMAAPFLVAALIAAAPQSSSPRAAAP